MRRKAWAAATSFCALPNTIPRVSKLPLKITSVTVFLTSTACLRLQTPSLSSTHALRSGEYAEASAGAYYGGTGRGDWRLRERERRSLKGWWQAGRRGEYAICPLCASQAATRPASATTRSPPRRCQPQLLYNWSYPLFLVTHALGQPLARIWGGLYGNPPLGTGNGRWGRGGGPGDC